MHLILAIKYKNRIEHALIYDPNENEMFTASRNQGMKLNGKRIRIKQDIILTNSIINLSLNDCNINQNKYNMFKIIVGRMNKFLNFFPINGNFHVLFLN